MLLSVVSKVEQSPQPGKAVEGAIPFPCPYLAQLEVKKVKTARVGSTELEVFSCSMLALLVFHGRVAATARAQLGVERVSPCVVGVFFWLGFSLPPLEDPQAVGDVGEGSGSSVGWGFWGRTSLSRERPCVSTVGFCVD